MVITKGSFSAFFAVMIAGILAVSCSAEKNNVISKGYHNTTARYNAIFYAKNRIAEIEQLIEDNHEENYDKILRIFPFYDSLLSTTYKEQTEDAIQKASIAIDRHKNSKFVDDAYLLVGKARMYDVDYVNAVETFKYVYKHGEDAERVLALAYLIRSYTDNGEYQNALEVSSYLRKEDIKKEQAKVVFINLAYLYQMLDDKNLLIQNLDKAAPLVTRADGKGRIYFIMGQVYESLGFESEAFGWYRKCIATHPQYELDFHARIRMAQVAELKGASDVKATRKLFEKLLVDKKNKQFIDKIYYEWGEFEGKQGNLDGAIDNYKLALANSTQPNRQKALSYLRLGQIYYDSLRKYPLAKAYYDSTIQILPEDFENYDKIAKRQSVLADFVTQITTIQLQDSLLELATIDSVVLRDRFKAQLVYEDSIEQRKMEEAEIERKRTTRRTNFLLGDDAGFSSTSWYFDNPTAIAQGQSEFRRIWGDRPLEDHWRRSSKQVFRNYDDQASLQEEDVPVEMQDPAEVAAAMEARLTQRVNDMLSEIPYTVEERTASLKMIEEAYYRLGNIYYFDLEEEKNAISSFELLYLRFPESTYTPEILYQLILIYQRNDNPRALELRKVMLSKYPNTMYTQLLLNPDYNLQSSQVAAQMREVYQEVYDLYQGNQYAFALAKVDSALNVFPTTDFTAQMELLRILILGKNETKMEYEDRLLAFMEDHPDHELTPFVLGLLETSEGYDANQTRSTVGYLENRNAEHYFVVMYVDEQDVQGLVNRGIQAYNQQQWSDTRLRLSSLELADKRKMALVTSFEDGRSAYTYLKSFERNSVLDPKMFNGKSNTFVISKHNFDILYQTGNLEEYLQFFNQNYRNGIFEEGQ